MKQSILRIIAMGFLLLAGSAVTSTTGWGGPPPMCDPNVQLCPNGR